MSPVGDEQERWRQDTRTPGDRGHRAIVDIGEQRMKWQKPTSDHDAFYNLPGCLETIAAPFGSSTRADWEGTMKNKRDTMNPYAGPGNYDTSDVTPLSTCRSAPNVKFGFANRSIDHDNKVPGPEYTIAGIYRMGGLDRLKDTGIGFNKDHRKPLQGHATDASYFPKLQANCTGGLIGQKLKQGGGWDNAKKSPGPIYNIAKYDFRTGPVHSFGTSKSSRFTGPGAMFA